MIEETLRDRIDIASSRIDELHQKASNLEKRLSDTYSLEEMAELARMLTEVRSDIEYIEMARQKTESQLEDELTRHKSSEYRSAVKRMDQIKSDNKRRVQDIDKTMHDLLDQIDELHQVCREYDALHRKHIRTVSPYGLMNRYGWINILQGYLRSLTLDLVYQVRRLE